jgi:hypothetical protein
MRDVWEVILAGLRDGEEPELGMSITDLCAVCAELAGSDDPEWRASYARECTARLGADGPTMVRQATFGDLAEVVEVDPAGIVWILSAFDGRRYWSRPTDLISA